MPTLTRLLIRLLILAGLIYGAMVAIVLTVEPTPREVRIEVPLGERLNR